MEVRRNTAESALLVTVRDTLEPAVGETPKLAIFSSFLAKTIFWIETKTYTQPTPSRAARYACNLFDTFDHELLSN